MTDEDLSAIEARAAGATPGPWTTEYIQRRFGYESCVGPVYEDDAAFIAAAREDVPRLLVAEVRALRELATALAVVLDRITGSQYEDAEPWIADEPLARARAAGVLPDMEADGGR